MRLARLLLVAAPLVALAAAAGLFVIGTGGGLPQHADPPHPGHLVVVAVFDQFRGDYVDRWAGEFGTDGFEAMKADGVWFSSTTLPYACAATGPGHASIGTGAPPSVHGIIENEWFDRGRGKLVQAWTDDARRFERVPPADDTLSKSWAGMSPTRLLAPGVGDALRDATAGKGRCLSVSLKARSAVLMGGKNPTAAYCLDDRDGRFHTSTYYRERVDLWVEAFNKTAAVDRWRGKAWERLKPAADYDRLAGPDDQVGEYAPGGPATRVFPHPLPSGDGYYAAVERSPFGNELLWEFARAGVEAEDLGNKGQPDLLFVGYSATDVVGHAFGPDSHEVMDMFVRADRLVADMIRYLDARLGRDRYTLVVTGDHGVTPLPERSIREHPTARRIAPADLVAGLDEALDGAFGRPDGAPGRWVEGSYSKTHPWVFLDRRTVEASGAPADEVAGYAARWLGNRPDAETAFTRKQIESGVGGDVGRAVRLAYHPDRCGDVYVLPKPYVLVLGGFSTGTNHGTPHPYDRHVPVLAIGAGVPKLGKRAEAVSSLIVAPFAAKLLGVPPPGGAKESLPAVLGG